MGKKLDISARAICDNLVFSKNDVMAYYIIPENPYDYLSADQKVALCLRISNGLTAITNEANKTIDVHAHVSSVPFDVEAWEEQVKTIADGWGNLSKTLENYIGYEAEMLREQYFMRRQTLLGISLGARNSVELDDVNVFEHGVKRAGKTLGNALKKMLLMPTDEVSLEEEKAFKLREQKLFTTISTGNLKAVRATAEEILLTTKRTFYPAMTTPYLNVNQSERYNLGDIVTETAHILDLRHRYLRVSHIFGDQEVVGYRATLTFSKFNPESFFPIDTLPFIYYASMAGAPFTMSSRFKLIPSSEMKKKIESKRKQQVDEVKNYNNAHSQDSNVLGEPPAPLVENMENLSRATSALEEDGKNPWVDGSYHITVEAPTEEDLQKYISQIKQMYKDIDITVIQTSGDQLDLMLEEMPGDHQRSKSFNQVTNLSHISTSGLSFGNSVGDNIVTRKEELS